MNEEELKEKRRKYAKEWYQRHKDDEEFKERMRAYRKKYMEKNRARVRKRQNEYYHRNIERMRVLSRKYYQANKEERKAYARKWRAEHPDRIIEYQLRRIGERKERKNKQRLKVLKPTEQISRIFKNQNAAKHYQWLMHNRGLDNSSSNNNIKKESEVNHEEVNKN